MNNRRNNFFRKMDTTRECSCGRTLKQKKRVNYPFGRNSSPITKKFYNCSSCNKTLQPLVKEARKLI
ncbi:MAG: hypothetical protein ACP5N7_05230 [Candidatus Pacearchaeota archaeon]